MGRENMSFEDQWSEAFGGAEVTPSDHLWASIDGALANKEAGGYKKRIVFFKWVTAASVALAVAFGIALLNEAEQGSNPLAESIDQSGASGSEKGVDEEPLNNEIKSSSNEQSIARIDKNENLEEEGKTIPSSIQGEGSIALIDKSDKKNSKTPIGNKAKEELPLNHTKTFIGPIVASVDHTNNESESIETYSSEEVAALNTDEIQYLKPQALENESYLEPWKVDFLYRVPDLSASKDLLAYQGFDLWAGVSFGSGSFNPGSEGSELESLVADSNDPLFAPNYQSSSGSNSGTYISGNSFSAGMDVGGKLSRKLLLSSGLHYNTVSPRSSSNIIITDNQSNESFALARNSAGNESLDTELKSGNLTVSHGVTNFSNTLQYLTIPLKAGYVVLDRKLNLTINSGMATNILIGSSLNKADGGLQNFGGSTNNNDAFNKTYFDLLTSIELGYKLMDKYHLSLEPNYRRAINSFTSEGSVLKSKPTNFGVSLGVKHEF